MELSCQLSMECKRGQVDLSVPWGWAWGSWGLMFFLKKKSWPGQRRKPVNWPNETHLPFCLGGGGAKKTCWNFFK